MQRIEDNFVSTVARAEKFSEIVEDLETMFKRDYQEFIRERKRWRSDFDRAT
jgi:hypothetical protein